MDKNSYKNLFKNYFLLLSELRFQNLDLYSYNLVLLILESALEYLAGC